MRSKKLGQHFLKNQYYINKIINSFEIPPPANLLEIGPGRGGITFPIVEKGYNVIAIEKDEGFRKYLKCNNLTIFFEDAVFFPEDIKEFLERFNISLLVSNLPFNAGTKIFLRYLKYLIFFNQMVLMFQREVGEKIIAESSSSSFGSISVITKIMADFKIICKVPPAAFSPKPKVESIVISFKPKKYPAFNYESFLKFLGTCFRHPRKKLYNNLIEAYKKNIIVDMFKELWIDLNIRPHQLDAEFFLKIFNFLEKKL